MEIGLLIGRFFLKTDDLHYGYWPEGLDVDISNLAEAQENHSSFIISHIPEDTKTILDVGAGAGNLAQKLLARDYAVDCVSPSSFLTDKLKEKLGNDCSVFDCKYEDLRTAKMFDLVLFSESFLYVNIKHALQQTINILKDQGHLLICDFFSLNASGKSPHRGGHKLSKFNTIMDEFSFEKIVDIDITRETVPTIQILNDFLTNVGQPARALVSRYLHSNYPRLTKFLKWKLKKRLQKIDSRYLSGKMTAEAFLKHKSYRLMLYKKI